ncbi:MAG TPA: L-seryl-tRNA(Sec) selenium transferase [Pararobbsia sp.]|nr:L-seryl-tRNA(Sec) selenium transferase [Pararobbsia sp.]
MSEDGGTRRPALSSIPSVEHLLAAAAFVPALAGHGRTRTLAVLRDILAGHRASLRAEASGTPGGCADSNASNGTFELTTESLASQTMARLDATSASRLRTVFNLTGTVLHTNLGRALLPDTAVQAVIEVMTRPANLEFDLETGARGDRDDLIAPLLRELTGAEAATVVNNNAAAVLLMLAAIAPRKEVIVSRGELVEIGGAFRIPDIMTRAGAKLREVGTTNRTHVRDYAEAIGSRTAMLMKVHASNYAIEGFTHEVALAELSVLGREHALPVAVDLGSGSLIDLAAYGLPREATVRETVEAGADLVTFSGDKLLGGPQAGLIVGRADLIAKIKKHPLKRALRVGKLTLAALEPVLTLYRSPEFLAERLTTLRLFTRAPQDIHDAAQRLQPVLQQWVGHEFVVTIEAMLSQIGSGALPVDVLPSAGLVIRRTDGKPGGRVLLGVEQRLRALPRAVIGRIADHALRLDLRCLEPHDERDFRAQLEARADTCS